MADHRTYSPPRPRPQIQRLRKTTFIISIILFLIVGGLVLGVPYYRTYVAPWYVPVVTVGDATINMKQFMKRLRLAINPQEREKLTVAMRLIQSMQREELIRQEAAKRNLKITEEQIQAESRRRVKSSGATEEDFGQRYEALLRGLRMSKKEFLQIIKTDIYSSILLESFKKEIPRKAPHVRPAAIVIGTAEKAEEVRARLKNGEDFFELAKTESVDLTTSKKGGDLGWFPKNIHTLEATALIHAKGILLKTEDDADRIYDMILEDGAIFAETAKAYSQDDDSRPRGGYLGWVSTKYPGGKQYAAETYEDLKVGVLSEPISTGEGYWLIQILEKSPGGKIIDEIIFSMEAGQVTPPLFTPGGFYLIKLLQKEPERTLTEEHLGTLARKKMKAWLENKAAEETDKGRIKWFWGSEAFNWAMDNL